MTRKASSLAGTDSDRQNTRRVRELRTLLATLEGKLSGGGEQDREAAIRELRNLGAGALPALPAIARAVGDSDELVVKEALGYFGDLCPAVSEQNPELWSRLHSCDDKVRLAAAEDLVRIFPSVAPGGAARGRDHLLAINEDAMPQARETPLSSAEVLGKWVAWDENQETVLAVADSYSELMRCIDEFRLVDPIIERTPGLHADVPLELLEGESADILKDVRETIPDAEQWLDTPNTRLWYKRPRELIGTPDERQLRYLLRGLWSGITS
jgi:hypothetical protein